MKNALIIFTREPIAGFTKTRLMPYLTGEECSLLHKSFLNKLRNNLIFCEEYETFICHTPEKEIDVLKNIFKDYVSYFPQIGNTLGERMKNSFRHLFNQGYERIVLIGSDVPSIDIKDIRNTFLLLNKKDVVLGPTEDGGYYLVGLSNYLPDIFSLEKYSNSSVLENTIKVINDLGLSYELITTRYDIDLIEDLERYQKEITKKISIIIPVYNEESIICETMDKLKRFKDSCEIIFVDGGSTDNTYSLIDGKFKVLSSVKGRGNQLNEGANNALGSVLLFLHADCVLPDNAVYEINKIIDSFDAGYFGIKYEKKDGIIMKLGASISNLRADCGKIVFGDQGLFIKSKVFFDLGGFIDIPIMEDYEFSKRLKKNGIKLKRATKRILADSRRFKKNPVKKVVIGLKMYYLRLLYNLGVSPQKIADLYN